MQPDSLPFALSPLAFNGDLSDGGFEGTRVLFFASLLFSQGGGMDLSKVGEKILSSVRSARSLGLIPPTSDRPEVPARAVAAAAVARVLAGLPPHQRHSLSSSSEELSSIYGSRPQGQVVEELEDEFYEEDFDPVRHVLENIPSEENDVAYFEEKATLRLAQLDMTAERLSRHVMEHHEEMVKGMHLVRELEKDLKIANVICMNGRRHLTSSRNEVSRDLIVTTSSKKKQVLLDMIPVLTELRHALDMQVMLENLVEEGNFFKAFQVLSEYLQILDSLSELSVIQEMSRGVEVWLGKTLQNLDSLLLGVCQDFKEEGYLTVVDAYALIGDVSGLAEKIQSFFMQEILSETHSALKNILQEDLETSNTQSSSSRLTYSDLCHRIPESKFRQCLLTTLAVVFKLMSSYYAVMSFQPGDKVSSCQTRHAMQTQGDLPGISGDAQHVDSVKGNSYTSNADDVSLSESMYRVDTTVTTSSANGTETNGSVCANSLDSIDISRNGESDATSSGSPWFQLRKDATVFVSQTLQRGRKNLWQLTTSRVSVLLSSASVCSTSIHQFLRNYEDLNVFILAGEAFCGSQAVELRQKVKAVCENYFVAFHRQNIYALKMVLEKEIWLKLPPETIQVVSFAGLLGDGAALIVPSDRNSPNKRVLHSNKSADLVETGSKKGGFSYWLKNGNPFSLKLNSKEYHDSFSSLSGSDSGEPDIKNNENARNDKFSPKNNDVIQLNGNNFASEDENEDLHADFIDEDSQLPSRISKSSHSRNSSSYCNDVEMTSQTGSSLCLLRLMDKYARLMRKLEIVNVEFFKGICQLFGIFFHFVFETFGQQNTPSGKGLADSISYRLKTALSRITQDCDQWLKPQSASCSSSSPTSMNATLTHTDVMPTSPRRTNFVNRSTTSFGLKERCAGADTISLVARLLHRSKAHLQSMPLQNNGAVVEDFYAHMVDSVPDLTQHIHRTTSRSLLHINGYVDRIANAKWEVKELGLEHNGYVDLLLGEFKHYKTRLAHGGIQKEVQDLLLEYGVEIVAETLIEGLSRVKRCSDEGRALMSLDLQVLINGLQHFVPANVRPKFQTVETFIKAYYLPETEYVHWARAHPEYSKSQIIGLINLVAAMKGWKRKTRLEAIEKIEGA
ncbi:Syndetin like [Actinidia chinensis var. chinensis]|uniref:Syndetin like n=1 Tax=Actinidia chinensis var. chinensis TaxID=1590841 RepID=A0A2R6PF30_ACTCC|nr:Syndetin like [Actinidia chinensis var. chinensis]